MVSRHAKVGLQMLLDRRAREESTQFYHDAEKADNLIRERSHFETRNRRRFEVGEITRRARQKFDSAQDALDDRRRRLYELLTKDDEQYVSDIESTTETPMQRRLRLMTSLQHLQAQRQQEHNEFVQQLNEQGWRDSCDPLRCKISEAFEKLIIHERDGQVVAHDLAKMEDDEVEATYAATVRANVEAFHREQAEVREKERMKVRRNRDRLLSEIRFHERRAEQQKEVEQEERRRFHETIEQQIREENERAQESTQKRLQLRKELDVINAEQLRQRQKAINDDKALDLKFAQIAQEELRKEREDAMVARVTQVRKLSTQEQLLSTQMQRTRAMDEETDLYIHEAEDEMNRKEDDARARDLAKRRNLMLDAVAHRVATIQMHQEQRQQRVLEKEVERQELEEDLAMKRQLDQEEYETKRRLIANQDQMLASQCRLKNQLERERKEDEKESVNKLLQSWKDEDAKIEKELAHPHALVGGRFRGHR
jgi:hypothetical protein